MQHGDIFRLLLELLYLLRQEIHRSAAVNAARHHCLQDVCRLEGRTRFLPTAHHCQESRDVLRGHHPPRLRLAHDFRLHQVHAVAREKRLPVGALRLGGLFEVVPRIDAFGPALDDRQKPEDAQAGERLPFHQRAARHVLNGRFEEAPARGASHG